MIGLLTGIWGKVAGAGVAAGAFFLWLAGQKRSAVKAEKAKQTDAMVKRIDDDRKRDAEIAALSPAERDARGHRWVRPDKPNP